MISFSVENLESFLMIFVRVAAIMSTAPFFSNANVPRRFRVSLALFTSLILFQVLPYQELVYSGVLGYSLLVVKEVFVGLAIGYVANICIYILSFAGQMIDMEIGFSMVSLFDPISRMQVTITSNFLTYMVTLIMIVSDAHYYVLKALIASFELIPLGGMKLKPELYEVVLKFMINYFIIGFRIILPVFAVILIVNIILGILAKVAPQMSLFVIGMQIKILLGFIVLTFVVMMLPAIADFITNEMKDMMIMMIEGMS